MSFDFSVWKSSTYRDWVFQYGLPCCVGIVGDELLNHFMLFAEVFAILSQKRIHPVTDIERARALITQFQQEFANFHGKFNKIHHMNRRTIMTTVFLDDRFFGINVCCLGHLPESVLETGPL